MVGLDNAGKTVAAKNLAGEDVETVMPTVGFSIVHLTYKGHNVDLFDLGGNSNIRGIWDKYFVYVNEILTNVNSFVCIVQNILGSRCCLRCGLERLQ